MITAILIVLVAIGTLENLWPLFIGYQETPQGYIFLGTVHHPGDYFYYLSQIAQGASRTITSVDLYTSESLQPSFVGWSNVLIGKIFSLFHVSPIIAYHTSVAILTVMVFVATYMLCKTLFSSKGYAVFSLYLFMLFHAFPLLRDGLPSYGDYWNNFAVPRVRIGAVPHQLLIAITSILLVRSMFLRMHADTSKKTLVGIICFSVILGSLQPVLWTIIAGVLILSRIMTPKRQRMSVDVRGLLAIGAGAIPVVYLSILFRSLPFSQLRLWEAAQQTILTPEHFLSATGPLFLVALVSIPLVLKPPTTQRIFLILFTSISIGMLISPLPSYMHISHVRFMSTLTILLLSIMAAIGLQPLITAQNHILKLVTYLGIAALSVYLLPNHQKTIELISTFHPTNLYEYVPTKDYVFFRSIAAVGGQNDTFLVATPYNELFPALSGKRSYNGHHLLTINAAQKDAEASAFFGGVMDAPAMRTFLKKHGISWVISTVHQPVVEHFPWASVRAKTDNLVLYAIQK